MNMSAARQQQPAPRRQSMLSRVTKGVLLDTPIRVILYGAEGVGKSTFASEAPRPIFLCSEDGTARLNVERLPSPNGWTEVQDCIRELHTESHPYKTLVLDTLDWLEPMCWAHVCRIHQKRNVEDFGYGKGYAAAVDVWRDLILQIHAMCTAKRMNLIALAHSHVKKIDDPLGQPYDRHCLKIHDRAAALWKESVDAVLFTKVEVTTYVDKVSKRTKGQGNGSRVVLTSPTAGYDAKNRFDLPDRIPLDWSEIEQAAKQAPQQDTSALIQQLLALKPRLPLKKQQDMDMFLSKNPSPRQLTILLDRARTMVCETGDEQDDQASSTPAPSATEAQDPEPGSFGLCLRSCRSMRSIGTSSAYAQDWTGPVLATSSRPLRHAPSSRALPGMGRPSGRTSFRVFSLSRPSTRTWRSL